MRRRMTKNVRDELKEIDYLDKLRPEDKQFLIQFLFEYYQADFNFKNPIHPEEYIKDCRDRNNASKRQIHSVGSEILQTSVRKVIEAQFNPSIADRYYTPFDHIKFDYEYQEDTDDDTE